MSGTPLNQRAGLLALYLSWGSTYPVMRVALRTMPPASLQAARCLLAVLPLILIARWRGADWPTARQWRGSLVVGAVILGGGHGLTAWAVVHTSGGVAALLVSMVSVWMAVLSWAVLGQRPTPRALAGIVLGLLGVALLTGAAGAGLSGGPLLALLASPLCWAAGSVLSLRTDLPADPLMATGAQLATVVPLFALAAAVLGEPARLGPQAFTTSALVALLYLSVVGYVLGFAVYTWLIRVADLAAVGTYAFANPVVAVLLGWALLGEVLTPAVVGGGLLVLCGVALAVRDTVVPTPDVEESAKEHLPPPTAAHPLTGVPRAAPPAPVSGVAVRAGADEDLGPLAAEA